MEEKRDPVSVRQVLETSPLYAKERNIELPFNPSELWPHRLELECPQCKSSRPHFYRDTYILGDPKSRAVRLVSGVYGARYLCSGCTNAEYVFFLEFDEDDESLRKVGQTPPWTVPMSSDLSRHLGESAEHYQRALVCLGESFGLGACAYLRRVLDDTVDSLLGLEVELLEVDHADKGVIDELRSALAAPDADTKLKAAYRHAPPSLIVDGHNPFKIIYSHLSVGLHRLDEDQCTKAAVELVVALDFVIQELNRRSQDRKRFVEAVKQASRVNLDG